MESVRLADPAAIRSSDCAVLFSASDLLQVSSFSKSIDQLLEEVSRTAPFGGAVSVSPMSAVTNYLCGYVTGDDLSLEAECVLSSPHRAGFELELALAVYEDASDQWNPQFEWHETAETPESALEALHDALVTLVSAVRGAGDLATFAELVTVVQDAFH